MATVKIKDKDGHAIIKKEAFVLENRVCSLTVSVPVVGLSILQFGFDPHAEFLQTGRTIVDISFHSSSIDLYSSQ
jgi:hypothetical protein